MSAASFIDRAERALRGETVEGVTVLRPHAPALLDAFGRKALLSPLLAGFMWAAVVFREGQTHALEPLALLLRLLALALTLRALILGFALAKRLRVALGRARHGLALCDEGLLLRTPEADFAAAKDDVVDVRVQELAQERSARRYADVYVVTRPRAARTHLAFPPVFEPSPDVLAERLRRWRGDVQASSDAVSREPAELASKLFDSVAAGERPPGVTVIAHGRGYLRSAPYATVLLGFAVLDGFLRLGEAQRSQFGSIAPMLAAACLGLVPLLWLLSARRDLASRKGIALVLTPAEVLLRTRQGVHRIRLADLQSVELASRTAWSLVYGAHAARSLVLQRKGGEPGVRYGEAFLGVPVEVALALCEGYRSGLLP
jgi:hypothetical protein